MSIPPFWGDVGVKKWFLFLVSGNRRPIFKCPQMGLRVPETKPRNNFFMPTSPQNGGWDICVACLPLFGWVLSQFWNLAHFTLYFTKGGQKKVAPHLEWTHIDSKMCSGTLEANRTRIQPVLKHFRHFAHFVSRYCPGPHMVPAISPDH